MQHRLPILPCYLLGVVSLLLVALVAPAGAQVQAMGAGAAWVDCDNDDQLDLIYLTPWGEIKVMMYNASSGRFADETSSAIPIGLVSQLDPSPCLGIACGDVNNDGWVDMAITRAKSANGNGGSNLLLLNNQDGTFAAASKKAGIRPVAGVGEVMSASVTLFDYNNDGLLDIYIANYEGFSNQLFRNDGIDEFGVPHFTDVAADLGVDRTETGSNWGLGLATADYDNDGDVDLYVANDYNGVNTDDPENRFLNPGDNVLYRNEGDGTFTDVSVVSGADEPGWAMGVTFGDYDRDGDLDIFLANFWEDALLENDGSGNFTDVSEAVGLVQDGVWNHNGWGTAFVDYDNDGDLDIHVSNGFITNDVGQIPNEPNQLWENRGRKNGGAFEFVEVGEAAGIDDIGDARGATYGDFNRDGFVDIAVINNNYLAGPGIEEAPVRLLYINMRDGTFHDRGNSLGLRDDGFADGDRRTARGNHQNNHWLQVDIRGDDDHPVVIGSVVTVVAGGKSWVQHLGASSYCSQNSPYLHFGLGTESTVQQLTVKYPDGHERTLTNVPTDQVLTVAADPTPVRLLEFSIRAERDGIQLDWRYGDDGDAAGFIVSRIDEGVETVVAPWIDAAGGVGSFRDTEPPVDRDLTYVLLAVHRDGHRAELRRETVRYAPAFPVRLLQNTPNPFRAGTRIAVEGDGPTTVDVFGVDGRLLRTLSGEGTVEWDGRDAQGRDLPAGTYFYRQRGSDRSLKMIRRP